MDIIEITIPIVRTFQLKLTKAELIALANGELWALDKVHEFMTQLLSVGAEELND